MKVIDFLKKLNELNFDTKTVFALLRSFIAQYSDDNDPNLSKDVNLFFESVAEQSFSALGTNINNCILECEEELKTANRLENNAYLDKVKKVKDLIQYIDSIYKNVAQKKYQKPHNISATVEQHESNLQEIKGKINDLKSEIKTANNLIDDKIFTLLINTVAILGIFVAIAFTGFGTMSILSNIDLPTAITSTEAFVKNVFFILLVSTLIYNLLLLLVYFIYKLSRPFIHLSSCEDRFSKIKGISTFSQVVNLKPFLWVDGVLTLLTIGTFIASVLIW